MRAPTRLMRVFNPVAPCDQLYGGCVMRMEKMWPKSDCHTAEYDDPDYSKIRKKSELMLDRC